MTTTPGARRILAAAALGLAALTLAACTAGPPRPNDAVAGPTPSTTQSPAATTSPVPAGQAADAVTTTSIDGTTLQIPAGRPAVLFFFSVGCGACVGGGTALAEASKQAAGKADFLLVDLDPTEPRQAIDYFRQRTGDPGMPVVTTGSLDLAQRWKITQLSTAIVIDKTGAVTYRGIDPSTKDLLAAIDKAAAK